MNLQIYGQIPDFNRKISTVRSRGIALIPITQNKRTIR
jgi:type IV secretory pathway TraG/TraD family ATPase VirD4